MGEGENGVLFDVLPAHVREDVIRDTLEPFGEAAWFAWRDRGPSGIDIRNGVWWREDGKRVLSLGMGTGLHGWGGVDWETYAFLGAEDGYAEDVCCHPDREQAEACALTFLLHGRYCSDEPSTKETDR